MQEVHMHHCTGPDELALCCAEHTHFLCRAVVLGRHHMCSILSRLRSASVAVAQATGGVFSREREIKIQKKAIPLVKYVWSFLGATMTGFDDLVTWTKFPRACPACDLPGWAIWHCIEEG